MANYLERLLNDKMREQGIAGFDELAAKIDEAWSDEGIYTGEYLLALVRNEAPYAPDFVNALLLVLDLSDLEALKAGLALLGGLLSRGDEEPETNERLERVLFRMAAERGIAPSWDALAEALNRAAPDEPGYAGDTLRLIFSVPTPPRVFGDIRRALVTSEAEEVEIFRAWAKLGTRR